MYCYECGSKILSNSIQCPYCGTELDKFPQLVADNIIDKVINACEINVPMEKIFSIGNEKIVLQENTYLKRHCFSFFENIFINSWRKIEQWIYKNEFDDIVEQCYQFQKDINMSIMWDVAAYAHTLGENVTPKTLSEIREIISTDDYFSTVLETSCSAFDDLKNMLDATKDKDRTEYNGNWVGSGSTIKSALVNSLKAEALNLAGAAVNELGNAIKRRNNAYANSKNIQKMKEQVKNSQEFLKNLKEGWANHIGQISSLVNFGKRRGLTGISWHYITPDEQRMYKCTVDDAIRRIHKDPYDLPAYVVLYKSDMSYGKELLKLAEECGVRNQVQILFLGYVDCYYIDKIESENIGFGTPMETLTECKRVLECMKENNGIYTEQNTLVYVHKHKQLLSKVESLWTYSLVPELQDKYRKLVEKESVVKVCEEISEEYVDHEREVVFHLYFDRLKKYKTQGKTSELSELRKQLEEAFTTGYIEAKDILTEFDLVNAGTPNEEVKARNNVMFMAAKGGRHSMYRAGLLCMLKNKEKGKTYITLAANQKCSTAMNYIALHSEQWNLTEEEKNFYSNVAELFGEVTKG